jgi:hypothetical protein
VPDGLRDFREQYPQYADLDDETLAARLYTRYYSDLEPLEYRKRMGLTVPEPARAPTIGERIDAGLRAPERRVRGGSELLNDVDTLAYPAQGKVDVDALQSFLDQRGATKPQRGGSLPEQLFAGFDEYRANRQTASALDTIQTSQNVERIRRGEGLARRFDILRGQIRLERELGNVDEAARIEARLADEEAKLSDPDRQSRFAAAQAGLRKTLQTAIDRRKELSDRAASVPLSSSTQEMVEAEGFKEAFGEFTDDPIRIIAELGVRSAPNLIEIVPAMFGGSLVAGPAGAIAGAGAGSAMVEYRASFVQSLEEAGVDLNSAESLLEAAANSELMEQAHKKALVRAGIIGATDAATFGVAGRALTPFKRPLAREASNLVAQMGVQAAGGAAGEAGAQLATEGEVHAGDVLAEAVGEVVTAPGEVATAAASGLRRPQVAQETTTGQASSGPADETIDASDETTEAADETRADLEETAPAPELGDAAAFETAVAETPPAAVAVLRADDLPVAGKALGVEGAAAIERAVSRAVAASGLQAYRVDEGEYRVVGRTSEELDVAVEAVREHLARQVVEVEEGTLNGVQVSAGVGPSVAEAEAARPAARAEPGDRLVLNSSRPLDMEAGSNYVPLISQHGDLPLNANREYVLGDGRTVRIPKEPVRRRHVIKLLERHLGTHIYQGRVKGKKTRLGFYRPGLGEVRIRNRNDLEVTAHEVAHFVDDRNVWVAKLYEQHADELKQVSYDVKKVEEGFAEFARLWLTQDNMAMKAAPAFYDAWMAELDKHPQLAGALREAQELMHAWHQQGARARLASKIGRDKISLRQRFSEVFDRVMDKFLQRSFDGLRAFKVIERAIRGELADATQSGYLALRLARGANGVVEGIFHRGTVNWDERGDLQFTGKGLKDVFAPVEDRMADMQLYMVARRAQELTEQGRENLFRPDEIAAGLAIADAQQGGDPVFAQVFEEWQGFNQRMLEFAESSGLLSAESRAAIVEANKQYVPFSRVVDAFNGARTRRGGLFMRLKGGTSNIEDVWDSIVANTTFLVHAAMQNVGKRNFYRLIDGQAGPLGSGADKSEMAALYAAPISPESAPVAVDKDQVIKAVVESMGLTMRWYRMAKTGVVTSPQELETLQTIDRIANGMGDMLTFFKPKDPNGNVDFYLEGGKKRFFEIADALLWEAIKELGPRPHNLALAIAGGFSHALRRGVTLAPPFALANFVRDSFHAFTLTKGQMFPIAPALKAMFDRFTNDPDYWLYVINGGGFARRFEAEGQLVNPPGIRSLDPRKVVSGAKGAFAAYDATLSAAEYANRIAAFRVARKKGESLRQAAYLGREVSTDFSMRGSSDFLRLFTVTVPFLNARLQGLYRLARAAGEMRGSRPRVKWQEALSFAGKALMVVTVPSVALYLMNRDDERYKELPDWVRDLHWFVPTGAGEDDYLLIPKPYEVGMIFGSMVERAMEYLYENDSEELANAIGWIFMEAFSFNPMPQAYAPIDELGTNKDFTGAPIIPEYLQDLEPARQYHQYTSDAMVALGRATGYSPIKAQHLVEGYLGTLGAWALAAADMMLSDLSGGGERPEQRWQDFPLIARFVDGGPLKRTHSESHFWDLREQTRIAHATLADVERRSPEMLQQYVSDAERVVYDALNREMEQKAAHVRQLDDAMSETRSHPEMSGEEKRVRIEALQRRKNEAMRAVMVKLDRDAVRAMIADAERMRPP